jgi:hypothetical protein
VFVCHKATKAPDRPTRARALIRLARYKSITWLTGQAKYEIGTPYAYHIDTEFLFLRQRSNSMSKHIVITDIADIKDLDRTAQARVNGRGVSGGYLFASPASGRARTPVVQQFFNFETFEVNNYETNNYIDKMIQQTVNQNQLNVVNVQAGDAQISVNVNQALAGSNATV